MAALAVTKLCAALRRGDRSLGDHDAKTIGRRVRSVRAKLAGNALLTVRMDSGADCTEILRAINDAGAFFAFKLRLTPELPGGMLSTAR